MKSFENYFADSDKRSFDISNISEAITKLPSENRKALELHFIEKKSRKQIASHLNWSLSKVNQKITRGITLLKYQLHPDYFEEMKKRSFFPIKN